MNLQSIKSINQYNNFLLHLNPKGKFQKKLIVFTVFFWLNSGILKTIVDKQIYGNVFDQLPLLSVSIALGIFFNTYLALFYGRKIINLVFSVIYMIGSVSLIISLTFLNHNTIVCEFSLYFISFTHYAICISAACILFECVETKYIPPLLWTFIFVFHIGKFGSILLLSIDNNSTDNPIKYIIAFLVLAIGIVYLWGACLYKQSLRYLIDTDINQAESLALKISEQNLVASDRAFNNIEGSFIWNKVNIKRYGLVTFVRFKSLSHQTCTLFIYTDYIMVSFLMLGIIGRYALAIFQINEKKKTVEFDSQIQLVWMCSFQLIGYLPGCIYLSIMLVCGYNILKRRKICLITSVISSLLSLSLLFMVKYSLIPHTLVVIFAGLGINSFLESILFFFMFLHCVELYPHTIRTLGCGLNIAFYYIGQLLFNLHIYFIDEEQSTFELVFCSCAVMVFHLYRVKETLEKGIRYQIDEIEQRDNLDN